MTSRTPGIYQYTDDSECSSAGLVYCRVEWHNSSDVPSLQALINSAYKKLGNMRAMPNGENLMESGARALSGRASTSVFNLTTGQYRNNIPSPQLDLRSITVNL